MIEHFIRVHSQYMILWVIFSLLIFSLWIEIHHLFFQVERDKIVGIKMSKLYGSLLERWCDINCNLATSISTNIALQFWLQICTVIITFPQKVSFLEIFPCLNFRFVKSQTSIATALVYKNMLLIKEKSSNQIYAIPICSILRLYPKTQS